MSERSEISKPAVEVPYYSGPIDLAKQKWLYVIVTLVLLVPGLFFIAQNMMQQPSHSPLLLGIDFVGGSMMELGFKQPIAQSDLPKIRTLLDEQGYPGAVLQLRQQSLADTEDSEGLKTSDPLSEDGKASSGGLGSLSPSVDKAETEAKQNTANIVGEKPAAAPVSEAASQAKPKEPVTPSATAAPTPAATTEASSVSSEKAEAIASVLTVRTKTLKDQEYAQIQTSLEGQYGEATILQRNAIGPALASELLKNGLLALLCAYVLIIGYLTYRFQFDYAVCAIIALVHDTVFVIGFFAMLGALFQTEVDSLFITGILTVVGFSVHDTIVVFDRVRENHRLYYSKKLPFGTIINMSVNQTLARSINTSLTTLITLCALYFWGGETTKSFMLCMILGILVGTFSSIFIASLLLMLWRGENTRKGAASDSSGRGHASAAAV